MGEVRVGDFDAFFEAPEACYGRESPYVSPLRSDLRRMLDPARNPLFRHHGEGCYYTVHEGGRVRGRIVAHLHRASNARHGERRSCFGFLDCADDPDVARALLGAAEAFGRARNATEIVGNFNLTAMQQCGVMTEGFENPPYCDQLYNPPHIPRLLEAAGYERTFPMRTTDIDLDAVDPESLVGPMQRAVLTDPSLTWAPLRRRRFPQLLNDIRRVLNDGFDRNPMFVPLTEAEFLFQARDLMWVIDPRISTLVYGPSGPVGAVLCIPDINPLLRATRSRLGWTTPLHWLCFRLRRTRAVIVFYSVAGAMQGRGLNGAMLYRVTRALRQAGYRRLGITWIAEQNRASLRQAEKLGGRTHHRLHLFRKAL